MFLIVGTYFTGKILYFTVSKALLVKAKWFKNLQAEICRDFNTPKYKNLFSQAKSRRFLQCICELQLNYDKHFNQGV